MARLFEIGERETRRRAIALLCSFCIAGAPAACGEHDVELAKHGGSGGTASAASLTFCDVSPILELKCQRCHADPPEHGAPFPLLTYDDTQGPMSSPEDGRAIRMQEAIESGFMPYLRIQLDPPVEALTCVERTTLLGWLEQGAPPADSDCSGATPRRLGCPSGSAGSAGSGG